MPYPSSPTVPKNAVACLLVVAAFVGVERTSADVVEFNRDIRPLLSNKCFTCHGPDRAERQADLRLDTAEGATRPADSGEFAVVPTRPEQSELMRRVTSTDESDRMPPADHGTQLTAAEIALLERWITEGATFSRHWSYVTPQRPDLPHLTQYAEWPRNEIDSFVLRRLLDAELTPAPHADRRTLIRRVTLDLTGLPPTPDEVNTFLQDESTDAYDRLVDRLLERQSYGEHWARLWLDLARYADSAGYADDPPRTIWAYRDYVIRSLNDNKPFDQFTIEQIAGDLLPDATDEQRIATAFHRNTLTNNEGGTSDEEFRNVAIVDRVNTTFAVWMGTTMACAQCHSHKYDPISQTDFFRVFAIFNSTQDADRRDESPTQSIWTDEQQARRRSLVAAIAALESDTVEANDERQKQLEGLRKELDEMQPSTTVPIMAELPPDQRRTTHLQYRGNFLNTGDVVSPGVPDNVFALANVSEENCTPDRLTLARWLIDDQNPLAARVLANRYWETLFGRGIVTTSEEFGSQGELPSHPELLDWLATELIRLNWDLKAFVRVLVTSSTYRQDSRVTAVKLDRDPDNRWLSRGPRFRMSAEMIRDQALAVSGLLSDKMYGPPVKPPQPALGLSAAFGSAVDWNTSAGEDRYRRALYTTWRRSNPYPSMASFDAPNREVCTIRRDRTNTPLQALVTLNDPVYIEAAQALARKITRVPLDKDVPQIAQRLEWAFVRCLSRPPSAAELDALSRLYTDTHERFAQDHDAAHQMATDPLGAVPDDMDIVELASWTVVSNVLLNLDELVMKR
ncbi:MAG: PSD1 domain-containing protein [Planctomycetales bacterium]|nr:PSD1 domain-containing protein [Planctomycetales bacterium]